MQFTGHIQDDEIVTLLRNRDDAGYTLLYTKYAPLAYGIICRAVNDPAQCDELLTRFFVNVWNGIGGYDGRLRFFTWMMHVLRELLGEHQPCAFDRGHDGASVLELVYTRNLDIETVAKLLDIDPEEVKHRLRSEIGGLKGNRN